MLYINTYIQVVPIKRKKKVILRYIGPYREYIYKPSLLYHPRGNNSRTANARVDRLRTYKPVCMVYILYRR